MMTSKRPTETVAQSRIGKRPVVIPDAVEVKVNGRHISVKGPKGSLEREMPTGVTIETKDNSVIVMPDTKIGRDGKRLQGLVRALIAGMVEGVSNGYKATLDLHGVGYRAELKDKELNFSLGFSHPVRFAIPDGIDVSLQIVDEGGVKRPRLEIDSHDKELLGQTVAQIRALKPPEPYKGKGIRIRGERIREKAGKAGVKA